jgi:hypothetical protein
MHIGFHIASSLARYELLIRSPNFRSWCFGERCNKLDIGIKPNFVKIHNKNIRNSGEEQGSLSQKVFPNQSCGLIVIPTRVELHPKKKTFQHDDHFSFLVPTLSYLFLFFLFLSSIFLIYYYYFNTF